MLRRHGLTGMRSRYLNANIAMNAGDDATEAGLFELAIREYGTAVEGFRADFEQRRDTRSKMLMERCEAARAALSPKDVGQAVPGSSNQETGSAMLTASPVHAAPKPGISPVREEEPNWGEAAHNLAVLVAGERTGTDDAER